MNRDLLVAVLLTGSSLVVSACKGPVPPIGLWSFRSTEGQSGEADAVTRNAAGDELHLRCIRTMPVSVEVRPVELLTQEGADQHFDVHGPISFQLDSGPLVPTFGVIYAHYLAFNEVDTSDHSDGSDPHDTRFDQQLVAEIGTAHRLTIRVTDAFQHPRAFTWELSGVDGALRRLHDAGCV